MVGSHFIAMSKTWFFSVPFALNTPAGSSVNTFSMSAALTAVSVHVYQLQALKLMLLGSVVAPLLQLDQ